MLAMVLVLSLAACGEEKKDSTSANEETTVSKLDAITQSLKHQNISTKIVKRT